MTADIARDGQEAGGLGLEQRAPYRMAYRARVYARGPGERCASFADSAWPRDGRVRIPAERSP